MKGKKIQSKNKKIFNKIILIVVLMQLIIFTLISTNSIFINALADESDSFTLKWTNNFGPFASFSSPVAEDIDGDGIYEIFQGGRVSAGVGTVICVDGSNGDLIWQETFSTLSDKHIPVAVGDLDGDGVCDELVHAAGTVTIAREASDGSIIWTSSADSGWSVPAIADLDDSGYPYVIVGDNSAFGSTVTLSKLYGSNGTVAASSNAISYTCYGGVSIADLDRDGEFEIMMSDSGDSICFDEDLNTLWTTGYYTSESHCAVLTNVTGDGDLEVVLLRQDMSPPYDGGIYVYYADGTLVPGMYDNTLGLGCHCQPSVYDIDKDGNVEVLTCFAGTYCSVWDLGDWSEDTLLEKGGEPPDIADVCGNGELEIVSPSGWEDGQVDIYDSAYNNIAQIGGYGDPMYGLNTIVQDIDNDGLNEIIISGPEEGDITVYNTLATTPTQKVRTDTPYYSERRTNVGIYIPKIGGKCELSNPSPSNGNNQVPISSTTLSISINEPDNDKIDWTIETSPNIGRSSGTNENSGTKTCTISDLLEDTTYTWYVNATDGTNWICQYYSFTTEDDGENDPPIITDDSGDVSIDTGNTTTLWVKATDDVGVTDAEISIDGGGVISMSWSSGNSRWEYDYTAPSDDDSDHTYELEVFDAEGLSDTSGPYDIIVTNDDTNSPQITDISFVTSDPLDTDPLFGWVNVSCTVTDDTEVSQVILQINNPDSSWNNVAMTKSGDTYYYHTSTAFSSVGSYSYLIWAEDTNENENTSSPEEFSMPPNWVITNSDRCSILDLVLISNQNGNTGDNGWIREDIDNNGVINIQDLLLVTNHFGENW